MSATSPPPSVVPRRSVRSRVANSPPAPRIKVSKPNSRLTTPFRAPERSIHEGSILSGMDVDEDNYSERIGLRTQSSVFAKSDQILVSFYASLPLEVRQVLRTADFFSEPYTGDIDTLTGFALVASTTTCFVWQHAQALKGTPTCYIFSCPRDEGPKAPPLHALVPYGTSREPGLILMSIHGKVRFWDSIGIGLAGGDRFITTNMALQDDETVTNLIRSDSQTYIVSTSTGGLYRLSLTSVGGSYHISSRPFAKPSSHLSSLSRFLPSLFTASPSSNAVNGGVSQNVSGIALGPRSDTGVRNLWAIVDTRVQRWEMKPEGWEQLALEKDVASDLLVAIRRHYNIRQDQHDFTLDLELLDIALDGHNIVLLISHANVEEESNLKRTYALALLSSSTDGFEVDAIKNVPYQPSLSTGAPMHPRITVLQDGILIGVQFGDAVALCAKSVSYRTCLELKTSADRTLGVGANPREPSLLILTAATMMKVTVNTDEVNAYDEKHGEANLVKSILKQAILYSGLSDNPLHFSFPPDVDVQSLMTGAEQISHAVMHSDVEVVQKNHDLTAQMAERKERLSWLIRFINDNAVLPKISQECRQRLEADAEKLYACRQLWIKHNELLSYAPQYSILNDSVLTYMEDVGETNHEDVLRAFFRLRVGDIEAMIKKVMEITFSATKVTGQDISEFLPQANQVVLTIIESAFEYREYNRGVYGITSPMLNPWTSKPATIDVILSLFDATSTALDGSKIGKEDAAHSQLPLLANILFVCIQERLDWLASLDLDKDLTAKQNYSELEKKFDLLRPEVFETLRKNGYGEIAFSLAERYQDFAGLATLCNRDTVYPPEENPNLPRIQEYMEKFREDFTTELYRWYIQHGELRVMFANDESHNKYMDQFFKENPTPSIQWIDDLGKGRYEAAADSLLTDSKAAHNLEAKQFMLSIGKLSSLVQLHGTSANQADTLLDAFHDELDFVSVQEVLLQDFKSALKGVRGRQSLESQADIIVRAKASKAQQQKAIARVLKGSAKDLLQGKSLSIENAVDVLTLKDNEESLGDYATALHLLTHERDLPQARKDSAFRTIWRRVFLHDDWNTIRKTTNISDAELTNRFRNTALFATLCTALSTDDIPPVFDTLPEIVQAVPSPEEISSRWPGLSEEETEAVIEDYNSERNRLAELDLSDVYHRVKELAAHEVVWKQNGN